LNALIGLREIWNTIDLKNISRLDSTEEAFKVSLEVYNVIMNNLEDGVEEEDEYGNKSTKPADSSDDDGTGEESLPSPKELSDEEFKEMLDNVGDESDSSGSGNEESEMVSLSDNQKKQLENAVKKQKKFMDGDIQKKKLSKKDNRDLETIDKSGMSYVDVAKGLEDRYYGKKTPTKVIMVKKLTKTLIESNTIGMLSSSKYSRYYYNSREENEEGYVEDGIRLGTTLGRKLQVRGESRETKWSRLDSGRIDKRLVAELGFGNDRVFQNTFVESYSDAFLHISIDASGSMGGEKWENTMTSVVALCKAVSMISNVDVVVTFRSTQRSGSNRRGSTEYPIVLVGYDSRIDKFQKVKNLFSYIRPSGTTPEGLCFEAILSDIVPTSVDRDSYFLNFSDGMPMFGNDDIDYHHDTAINHTKKMVDEIRNMGVSVLSYFIGDTYDRGRSTDTFKKMYGKDAEFIDVTNVMSVSKTMNKRFLEKN
jgi:nitric oxide reductase activation protein